MKSSKSLIYLAIVFALFAAVFYNMSGNDENYQFQIDKFRATYQKSLTRGADAPIQDPRNVKGLRYFPVNMDYLVQAKVKKFEEFKTLQMTTNRNEKVNYIYYATLSFELLGKPCELVLFQNQKNVTEFFLPFTDLTTGESTYGSGRYLNVKVSENNSIELDFNKSYNPFCAYNDNYSCPIPPKENQLLIKIEAGEKTFSKK